MLRDGRKLIYRRTRRDDEEALYRMFTTLSQESLYMRFIGYCRPARDEIRAILEKEVTQETGLVATPVGNQDEIVAQARCILLDPPTHAELAIVVHDDWQNQGLGTALLQAIVRHAIQTGVERIVGVVGLSNDRMIHVFDKLGFATRDSCYDTVKMARLLPGAMMKVGGDLKQTRGIVFPSSNGPTSSLLSGPRKSR